MSSSKNTKEFFFKEGCFIQEWHNNAEDQEMSIARVRVAPLSQTRLHALRNTNERYVILSGEAEVSINDKRWMVGVGDVVVIPAGLSQKIQNILNEDLIFLAICQPRFLDQNYQDLEDE